ncbi:VanZ family protein [Gandjariella thermophila]|uniref:VanZ family protein n=1 Tax=Gandjariella thermophila TaxID=1931992 RepID=UPI0010F5569E|nr:VanZ family protein [Gandjariella thermophila]
MSLGAVVRDTGLFPALLVYPLVGALLAVPVEASGERLRGWPMALRVARTGVLGYLTAGMILLAALPGPGWRGDGIRARVVELVPLRALVGFDPAEGMVWSSPWWHVATGALFVPFALLLVLRPGGPLRMRWVLAISAAFAVLLECLQYVLGVNRLSSVDDVLLALVGATVGALLGHGLRALADHRR